MAGLSELIGNEQVKEYFAHALSSGKISHCYILGGEDGIGKMTAAKAFAQTLLCDKPDRRTGELARTDIEPTGEMSAKRDRIGSLPPYPIESKEIRPCMQCHSCVRFLSGNHPDVIYPVHEKPSVIGVDDVREQIVADIQIRPYDSPYKIYILDEAEKLSVQAQNALLKTIEEPPSYGILLLLTTNPAGLLDTIRSRSIILNMKPVPDEKLEAYLKEKGVSEEKIPALVRFSQGNIGKAMKLSGSEDFSQMTADIMDLLKNADRMKFEDLLGGIERLEKNKLDAGDCLSFIRMWYRDVLMYKATKDPNLVLFGEELLSIRKFASECSYNGIERILDQISVTERRLDANVNFSLSMELLWMTIRDSCKE